MPYDDDDPPPPPGVTLRDPEDTDALREGISSGVMGAMNRYVHGYEYGGVRLELANVHLADKDHYTLAEQNEALMTDKLLARRLRGDVRLVDTETNKTLDVKKKLTLARLPYLTERGTFINNGSEYSPISQSRLLPGAYTRRRENGELETHFNARPGTGSSMRLTLDPRTAVYRLKVGTSDVHAYSMFKDMGVTDEELERRWGPEILAANKAGYSKDVLDRVYNKTIPKWNRVEGLPREDKVAAIDEALKRVQVAERVLRDNLPNLYDAKQASVWRASGRALSMIEKSATDYFAPDYSPNKLIDEFQSMDFDVQVAFCKEAAFDPDLPPDELHEVFKAIQGEAAPHLASAKRTPEHWNDSQEGGGWLPWYQGYHAGTRGPDDERQIRRWNAARRLHGANYVKDPTPRRGHALKNWAIDPLKLLPEDQREAAGEAMKQHRRVEYVKWFLNRHDFDDSRAAKAVEKAKARGGTAEDASPGTLMRLALEGHLQPEDIS